MIRAARVPKVHCSTAARALKAAGHKVQRRAPRLKPDRTKMDEAQRKEMCEKLCKLLVRMRVRARPKSEQSDWQAPYPQAGGALPQMGWETGTPQLPPSSRPVPTTNPATAPAYFLIGGA